MWLAEVSSSFVAKINYKSFANFFKTTFFWMAK